MPNPHWSNATHILTRTGAPDPLVTLAEAKAHLEYADTDRDGYINSLIAAATEMLDGPEGMIGKAVGEQVWTYALRCAPSGVINLPVVPVKALQAVSYFDADNVAQVIAVDQFRLVANEDFAYLEPVDGFTWPVFYDRGDAVRFTLQLGLPEVPAGIKHAALLMISNWFENREAVITGTVSKPIEFALEALINRWRVGWLGA